MFSLQRTDFRAILAAQLCIWLTLGSGLTLVFPANAQISEAPYTDPLPTPKPNRVPSPKAARPSQENYNLANELSEPVMGSLLERALELRGVPYRYGGASPDQGFDCSGFVRFLFREHFGLSLAGRADEIVRAGKPVQSDQLKPGDLVFFNTLRRAFSHVGVYLGNNEFIHAPATGGVVRIEQMSVAYWARRFEGARRMVQIEVANRGASVDTQMAHGSDVLGTEAPAKEVVQTSLPAARPKPVVEKEDPLRAIIEGKIAR